MNARILAGTIVLATGATGAVPGEPSPRALPFLRDFEVLHLDPADLRAAASSDRVYELVADGRVWRLKLAPHDIRAESYRATVQTDGGEQALPRTPALIYKGSVQGEPNSIVRLGLSAGGVEGYLLTDREWIFIQPLAPFRLGSRAGNHVSYRREDVAEPREPECAGGLAPPVEGEADGPDATLTLAAEGPYFLEIATEADHEMFQAVGGSAEDTNLRVLLLLSLAEGIFERDLGVSFRVTFQNVWATASDPYSDSDGADNLFEFAAHWGRRFRGVRRDVAHLWSAKRWPDARGWAFLRTLCGAFAYGVTGYATATALNVQTPSHEFGHNFGGNHLEDPCPRNLMATRRSCSATGFSPASIEEMTPFYTRLGCLR